LLLLLLLLLQPSFFLPSSSSSTFLVLNFLHTFRIPALVSGYDWISISRTSNYLQLKRSSSKRKTSTRFGPQKDRKLCVTSQAPRATSELRKTSNRPQEELLLLLVLLYKSDAEGKHKDKRKTFIKSCC
jgi:hypothetical protein